MIAKKHLKVMCPEFLVVLSLAVFLVSSCGSNFSPPVSGPSGIFLRKPVWTFETPEAITATPAGDQDGRVFVRMSTSVMALDAKTGQSLWRAESPSDVPLSIAPLVADRYLIVPERDYGIAAFSTETGRLVWRTARIPFGPTHQATSRIVSLQARGDAVYVVRYDSDLTAYRITDGEMLWGNDISGRADAYLVQDDHAAYLGKGSLLTAFNINEGAVQWQENIAGYMGPMLLAGTTLYVTDDENAKLLAIDLNRRSIKWEVDLRYVKHFGIQCLSIYAEQLLVAGTNLTAVSGVDGRLLWQTREVGYLECPVSLAGIVFVRNIGNALLGFDRSTGAEVGSMTVERDTEFRDQPGRSPSVANGLLIVPESGHKIAAYGF